MSERVLPSFDKAILKNPRSPLAFTDLAVNMGAYTEHLIPNLTYRLSLYRT
ncbi:hypothetical protein [Tolypothrix sp. FACHB-123]|uniref:hypothetical protein n=1 Tax=Tolypothrix sp. FACHB-123 TaxID=2692868 RepID=UPI001687EAA1|nr:hypothetical protein [Tolypothrix sp. FACHB-123]